MIILQTVSEFIYCTRTAEFLGERTPSVLISGKIIWKKKQSPVRITFSYKTGQPMSTTCGCGKKEHLFTEQLPLADFRYSLYFLLELKKVDVRLKKKKMKFYKETMKKTRLILYRTKNKQQLVILRQQENPPHLRALQVKVEYRTKIAAESNMASNMYI